MSELSFSKGKFLKFKAKNTIHLGRLERNIYEGDIVEFDGFTLKFNGQNVDMPELKAGIKRGWLTPSTDTEETPVVVKPNPKAETPSKVQVVYDEERSVTTVKKEEAEAPTTKFPIVVESSDEDTKEVSFVKDSSGASISSASSASDSNTNAMAEAQASKSITPALKTASKQKTILTDASAIDRELSKLEELEGTRSSFKVTVIEDQNDATPLEEENNTTPNEDLQTLQAIESTPATGAVATGTDQSKIVTLEGGVEWDMNIHWAKRAKKAVELYANDPETLELIYKVETKGVIASIQKSLAELA